MTRQAMKWQDVSDVWWYFPDVFSHYLHDHVWNQFLYDSSGKQIKETAEYVELLENAGVGSGLLKGIGICFIAVGIWEAVVGFLSVRNSNRVDKSRFSVKLAISLLITEIVMQVILFFTGLMNLGLLFTAIVLPLFLLGVPPV